MIIFENEGLLDIRAIKTMGVSVKEEGAIGYFGTGLKYALAVLLRTEHKIDIYIDGEHIAVSSKIENIRGKDFQIVTLNGEELGFTTELGKNWEVWQAFRELACNAMDEKGKFFSTELLKYREPLSEYPIIDIGADEAKMGKTIIVIEGDGIDIAYDNKDEIFYSGKLTSNHWCDTINKPSKFIYYRGVKVYELETPSKLTYNIKEALELTEDRTLASFYSARRIIAIHIMTEANQDNILTALRASKGTFELDLDFDQYYTPSEDFIKVTGSLVANKKYLNTSAKDKYVSATDYRTPSIEMKLNDVQEQQLAKALAFLKRFEENIEEYPITIMQSIGEGLLGRANLNTMDMEISSLVFEQGTKQVATTILEEFYHLKHGFKDLTYPFQSFLFDRIISVSEELIGEPL